MIMGLQRNRRVLYGRSSIWIHNYLPISLIPSFGILSRLAKFFVLEYTGLVGLRTEFRCLSGQIVGPRS